jgi:tRNA 5-methylaminomethyl-2-thiouridine biosynthesis bifunctional protein
MLYVQFTDIKWINNTPYSVEFNDIYFSTDDGLDETKHVFIEQNQLEMRFKSLPDKAFTIIETGFGTGLNFLVASALWLKYAPLNAKLNFTSIEKYPLKPSDLSRAHAQWSQFFAISSELLEQYKTLKPGKNHFSIAGGRIQLDLQVDDIALALPQLTITADAWFLDGFAPAKNTEMWSTEAFVHIARLSQANTTFATFTSAGLVRRGLQAVGFKVEKQAGFGKKREMLCGIFVGKST